RPGLHPCVACPETIAAHDIQTQPTQGKGDDTAVNGIRLHCLPRSKTYPEHTITSSQGPWGSWTSPFWCHNGNYLTAFTLKVKGSQGHGDNTAVNNIRFSCSDGQLLAGVGHLWGSYGAWSQPCTHGVCGILTKVQGQQLFGDNTALNDVQFYCCANANAK
uniref:Vitelline membrane outer layer protein 1 n=1 Tax=Leptobrachium leishanense TaxID=445787 RepID=A0A8C5MCP5_9ANUR